MPPSPGLLFASLSTGYVTLLIHFGKQLKESYATSKAPLNLAYSSDQFLHFLSLCKPSDADWGLSLALATSELLWLQFLFSELGIKFKTPLIHCDNIESSTAAPGCPWSSAMCRCHHVMTNALSPSQFEEFRSKLTVCEATSS
ncbi:hypothetical protein KIW84_032097 [Lathyrus oleraceus]|uniref:Uncharacterized protein n=1 Tax=Pisum sativum TaxID=3888 RepID=A0A9D5B178_PEA|nr:hypothetical protein KIW84_032097 [Pisum sativum]